MLLVVGVYLNSTQILPKKFKIDPSFVLVMYVLVCRGSGLDCDFVIKGKTKEEFWKVVPNMRYKNMVCAPKIST